VRCAYNVGGVVLRTLYEKRHELVLNTFVYVKPLNRFENKDGMRRFMGLNCNMSNRFLKLALNDLFHILEDRSIVSYSSQVCIRR